MKTSAKKVVQLLVEELLSQGVENVIFSPGSRSAPLVIAFNAFEEINKYVILDERSAGFFALGIALESKKPVVLVCTSGSAAVNYFPAITEAYYQGVPLIVLTADRPIRLINQGDGQTIMQDNVFGKHVRFAGSISDEDDNTEGLNTCKYQIREAYQYSLHPGPVHLNIHLSEPLYEQTELSGKLKFSPTKLATTRRNIAQNDTIQLNALWNNTAKKMIIIGQLQPCAETEKILLDLACDTGVAILTENISNQNNSNFITSIERAFSQMIDRDEFVPELLIVLGSSFVSKSLKTFLRQHTVSATIIVDTLLPNANTFSQDNCLNLNCSPLEFLTLIEPDEFKMNQTNYGSKWKQLDYQGQSKQEFILENTKLSDLSVMDSIISYLPESCNFHVGNSSVIRYSQCFSSIKNIKYASNRGVAGIDGSLSTAVGAASFNPKVLNVVVLGELSFFYDSNALLNHYLNSNLKIIVINNGGGSIFNMIPGPKSTNNHDKFFVAQQNVKIDKLCAAFSITHRKATNLIELGTELQKLFFEDSDCSVLLEINTENCKNEELFESYLKQMTS
jgi:2-succinyl-5-enolpyruvyl-6-hydroxy-3-cyclohexene-1-carboxylate synthase